MVIFEPLVTLHAVAENDNVRMNAVIHLFSDIAEDCNCAVELCHHTRKLANGVEEYGIDDSRGASAVIGGVRALRIVNAMAVKEAAQAGIEEENRRLYFRVDRGKANYLPPAMRAAWHQFKSIVLPSTQDNVGVVTAWEFPGQDGAPTAAKTAADHVFLEILRRFTAEGRNASDSAHSSYYAPALFAEEDEARIARVSKADLVGALKRLRRAKLIRVAQHRAHREPDISDLKEPEMRTRTKTRVSGPRQVVSGPVRSSPYYRPADLTPAQPHPSVATAAGASRASRPGRLPGRSRHLVA